MAYPLVSALVVLPTASSRSVRLRIASGWWDISMMPPALSVIGPNVSIARMYAAVPSIPIVATAVPNSPEWARPLDAPSLYDAMMAAEMVNVGKAVHSRATANPAMMLVAGPVTEAAAMLLTGR